MEKYLEYWELTWLGKVNMRTGIRGRPRFKHERWNKFETVKNGSDDLTINNSEAYNHVMKLTIPMKPNLFAILKGILDEERISHGKLVAELAGNRPSIPNPSGKAARLKRMKNLQNLVKQFGDLPLKEYMKALMTF